MTGQVSHLPTPSFGLNYIDTLTNMDARFCIECVNFFPTPNTLQLRSGFMIADDFGSNRFIVGNLITYNEINGNDRIFAVVRTIDDKYYIVDKSITTTGISRLPNFQVSSYNIKYIVNANLFRLGNVNGDNSNINNLVLGVTTKIPNENSLLSKDIFYAPFYLQNEHWANYHIVPTTITDGYATVNPDKIAITNVVINPDNTIQFTLPSLLLETNQISNQVFILQSDAVPTTITPIKVISYGNQFNLNINARPINPNDTLVAGYNFVTLERYLCYDVTVMKKFRPIALTQGSGYTAFIFKDSFHLYLVPSTGSDSYSARYESAIDVGFFNSPIIIPYGYSVKNGGYAVDVDNWTVDSGGNQGSQDYLAIFISSGDIIVYNMSGSIPTIAGVYKTGDIFAPNCTVKINGDLLFISYQGLQSMNALVGSTRVETNTSISKYISYQLSSDVNAYRKYDGWSLIYFQPTNMLIINIPTSNETSFQYVMNTTTGAWTKFTNINARCYGQVDNKLYFGNDQIYLLFNDANGEKISYDTDIRGVDPHQSNYKSSVWDETNWDESVWAFEGKFGYRTSIGGLDGAYFKQAFNTFEVGNRKKLNLIKPNIYNYSLIYKFEMGVGVDYISGDFIGYDASLVNPKVAFLTPPVYVTSDNKELSCRYDRGFVFGAEQVSIYNAWFNLPAFGFAMSYQFRVFAYLNDFEYTSTDLVFENSKNII